jgi:MFS transporter, Spinster family, sphingosine-1-phosphate transporter
MPESKSPAVNSGATYALLVVTLLNFLNYIDRFILAAVLPRVKTELFLTDFQLGLLANAFLVAYFLTSPLFGILGDRASRPRLMGVGVGLWSIATAAAGLTRNFAQLLVARAWVGVGEAAYTTVSPALLSDYYPRSERGRAFAIFYVAIPVGAAAGFLLGGSLERAFGWRVAFYAVGLPGIILAFTAGRLHDPPRGASENTEPSPSGTRSASPEGRSLKKRQGEGLSVRTTLITLLGNTSYVGTVLGYAAYTFAVSGLGFFMPTYLERVRGVELSRADFIVGSITVIGGLCGTFAGGYLGDLVSSKIKHGQLWLCAVSSLAGIVPTWLALTVPSFPTYAVWFFVAEFLLFLSTGPVNVVMINVVPVGIRAMAMAVSIFTIHLLGDAISPPIIGWLADRNGLDTAVLIVPVAVAISGVIWTMTALRK